MLEVRSITPLGANKYRLDGILKMHNVERPVSFEVEAAVKADGLEARGEVPLNITWFGLRPPAMLGFMRVSPDIKVVYKTYWKKT